MSAKRKPVARGASAAHIPAVGVEGLSPREQVEFYLDRLSANYDLSKIDTAEWKNGITFHGWRMDDLIFARADAPMLGVARTNRKITSLNNDFVRIILPESDSSPVVMGDEHIPWDTGALQLVDFSAESTQASIPGRYQSLFVPHARIGYDPAVHPPALRVGPETPIGRILITTFKQMIEQLDQIHTDEAPRIADGFCSLIRGLLFTKQPEDDESFQEASGRAMRAFLNCHLRDAEIGIDQIAESFGASRSTIYRRFGEFGGIDNYVTQRRLERAYMDLLDGPSIRGLIAKVAEDWQFKSPSHFYRLFRERFDCAPGDILTSRSPEVGQSGERVSASTNGMYSTIDSWFRLA